MKQPYKHILVPIDFSDASRRAAHYAIGLTARFNPKITLLHVWELPSYVTSMPVAAAENRPAGPVIDFAREGVRQRMTSFMAELQADLEREMDNLHYLELTERVEYGRAAPVIVETAQKEGCDLIVMGTCGRNRIAEVLMGSVTAEVVRRAECPVMAVPPDAAEEIPQRIVVPVDLGPQSRDVLARAVDLAVEMDASVTCLYVAWEAPPYIGIDGLPIASGSGADEPLRDFARKRGEESLRRLVAEVDGLAPERFETRVVVGAPAQRILEAARDADLLVMGTHGRTGLAHLLMGSVTERVIRHAKCPTLTLRSSAIEAGE